MKKRIDLLVTTTLISVSFITKNFSSRVGYFFSFSQFMQQKNKMVGLKELSINN